MDFRLGPETDAVRAQIRDFLAREFSEGDRLRMERDGGGHDWDLYRKLAAEGWVSAGWPKELGGGGRSSLEILAVYWELSKAGFPWFGMMNNGFICESANIQELDPEMADIPIAREREDNVEINCVMSNSFGFGGTNGTLVFKKYDA